MYDQKVFEQVSVNLSWYECSYVKTGWQVIQMRL